MHFILWELPLRIGNQLYHAAVLRLPMQQCVKTVRLDSGDVLTDMARYEEIVRQRMLALQGEQGKT
jgi:hypothetical protein